MILYILELPFSTYQITESLLIKFLKTKIIIISQSPFYFDRFNKRDIVLTIKLIKNFKLPLSNKLFQFIKFMNKNKFYLMSKNYNRVIKFLILKLKNNYKDADMYDLLFKKK